MGETQCSGFGTVARRGTGAKAKRSGTKLWSPSPGAVVVFSLQVRYLARAADPKVALVRAPASGGPRPSPCSLESIFISDLAQPYTDGGRC